MRPAVLIGVTCVTLMAPGVAAARTATQQALVDSTVRFLQESQRASGGFVEPGQGPSQITTSWAVLALEGAGINPQDQARCGTDAYTFLATHFQEGLEEELAWPQIATTAFERELLVVDGAAGADPHNFAGHDLVAEILARRLPDGSFPYTEDGVKGESNDTIFAILALGPIDEGPVEEAVAAAREWVVAAQDEDGGWDFTGKSEVSEVDMTGAALEALVAAGPPQAEPQRSGYAEAIEGGLEYLHAKQRPDGGWPLRPTQEAESNVASTAWAAQGIWATGGNPEEWKFEGSGPEPLGYMKSMQQPDGHIRWKASSDANGIWMTAYVTPAFAGQALPIPPAARGSAAATRGEAAACEEPGQGGQSTQTGQGVIAGGGGHHAPLFSRPKRGSKGRTPGGARLVRGEGLRAREHGGNQRGSNLHQAEGAETAEPASPAEAEQEVESVSPTETPARSGSKHARSGGGGDGSGPGGQGTPLPAKEPPLGTATTTGEEVSGVVIGSPEGADGKLAFGAPGLRSGEGGSGEGPWPAIAIGLASVLAALAGLGWERRAGRIA